MMRLLAIRHAPTDWNRAERLQGRTDIELASEAEHYLSTIILPPPFDTAPCYSSPLQRAMATARLLGCDPIAAPALIEMDWGDWEGLAMTAVAARLDPTRRHFGLDYAAPDGESPRQVQQRLLPFLKKRAMDGEDILVVSHKGVIRALYALAVGWDMTTKPPDRLDFKAGQLFSFDGQTGPRPLHLNLPLDGRAI